MSETKIGQVEPVTLALFEGALGAVVGLALALIVLFQASAFGTLVTDSILAGLLLGLGTSAVIIIALPVAYFAIGWVLGYAHGRVFNWIAQGLGGLVVSRDLGPVTPLDEADMPVADEVVVGAEEAAATPAPMAPQSRGAVTFGERIGEHEETGDLPDSMPEGMSEPWPRQDTRPSAGSGRRMRRL